MKPDVIGISDIEQSKTYINSHQNREFLDSIINAVADPVFVKDRQHRWVLLNEACCHFIGHSRDELIGKSDYDFFPKKEADIFWQKDENVFTTEQENINEEEFTDSDDIKHTVVTKKMLLKTSSGERFIVGIIRDITEQKRAERALTVLNTTLEMQVAERTAAADERAKELVRSNADLERFAYIASHDLQEPLRIVASYVQLIERRYIGKLDKDADEFIRYVVDGVTRMKALINDLLEYSRLSRKSKHWKPTDTNAIVKQVLATLKIAAQEANAAITWSDLPIVQSDPVQLTQVFQNLIANAIKFHGVHAPRIHIAAEQKKDHWVFTVSDNGIGIEPQHAERIFDIFQRLHPSDKYPGTGIGLAICKRIIERHGGRIWVESIAGEGTTFKFTLSSAVEAAS